MFQGRRIGYLSGYIGQPDIDPKGRQAAAEGSIAAARIESDPRQYESLPCQAWRETRHQIRRSRIKVVIPPIEGAKSIAVLRRELEDGHFLVRRQDIGFDAPRRISENWASA